MTERESHYKELNELIIKLDGAMSEKEKDKHSRKIKKLLLRMNKNGELPEYFSAKVTEICKRAEHIMAEDRKARLMDNTYFVFIDKHIVSITDFLSSLQGLFNAIMILLSPTARKALNISDKPKLRIRRGISSAADLCGMKTHELYERYLETFNINEGDIYGNE